MALKRIRMRSDKDGVGSSSRTPWESLLTLALVSDHFFARNQTTSETETRADCPTTANNGIRRYWEENKMLIWNLPIDVWSIAGSIYMVMEYMDHDLSGILGHPEFKFDPSHAKSLVKQMLEGLAYLHKMGIMHRDIKGNVHCEALRNSCLNDTCWAGSNLLINKKGELKIADFGLARVFQKNGKHEYTNRVITFWYRPPELLLGATAYGPAVDIWSVG